MTEDQGSQKKRVDGQRSRLYDVFSSQSGSTIKFIANPKKTRNDISCYNIEKIIDYDKTKFKDLVESTMDKYPSGYKEIAHVQYNDADLRISSIVNLYSHKRGSLKKPSQLLQHTNS